MKIHQGKAIEKKRAEKRISKAELADKIGMSRPNIHYIIGQPDIKPHILKKISAVLDHDFIKEFYGSDKPENNKVEEPHTDQKELYILQGRVQQLEIMIEKNNTKKFQEIIAPLDKEFKLFKKDVDKIFDELKMIRQLLIEKLH